MLFWTAVIALATIAYVVVSASLFFLNLKTLKLTKRIVELTNRPFLVCDCPELNLHPEPVSSFISFAVHNKGTVPSSDIDLSCTMMFNTTEIPLVHERLKPFTIFQDFSQNLNLQIKNEKNILLSLQNRLSTDVFELVLTFQYRGIAELLYETRYRYRFNPQLVSFDIVESSWT
jgi:hypothetical protein